MEYINTLIATNSVQTKPNNISNKQDLIRKGVDFTDTKPIFEINLPNGGAIVRDIHLYSSNVLEITVTFTTESGRETVPIKGAPQSLPTTAFPIEKVTEIVVTVTKTIADTAPEDVTLSVIACAKGSTTTASTGTTQTTGSFTQVSSQSSTTGLSSVPGTSVSSEGTTQTSLETMLSTLGSSSSNAQGTSASSQGSPSSSASPTATTPGTTTRKTCEEME
jgi:hypothetical protein